MNAPLRLRLALLLVFLCLTPAYPLWAIVYVDANTTGANNGSSWTDAYNYLQDALTAAGSGTDIWVVQGTYKPDANTSNPGGTGSRIATFQLKNGVALYGGFPTGGGSRDPDTYVTSLSGDIGVTGDKNDNSYHVVTSSGTDSTAILDGFAITGGNATFGENPNDFGGGMLNDSSSPMVTNCTFTGNSADSSGGGMDNSNSSPTLTNCTFTGNSAPSGGGICNWDSSSPMVTNCTFTGNSASGGGGMCNLVNSSPTVTNCSFAGNSAGYGAGMYNYSYSNPTVTNSSFTGNSANNGPSGFGGGMYNYSANPNLTSCTFSNNSAKGDSGFSGYGGGVYNYNSNPTLANCILWGNTAPTVSGAQIQNVGTSSPSVNYCDVQGGYSGTGNINANPLFVDANGHDNIPGTADDNLRLLPDSPCIDKGDNNSVPPDYADLDGDSNSTEPTPLDPDLRPRFTDGDCNTTIIVDMGAFEFTHAYLGDFDSDCDVDFVDFAIQASSWLTDELLADIAPTPAGNGIVDTSDVAVLCDNWLESF